MNKNIVLLFFALRSVGGTSDQTSLDKSEGSSCSWNGLDGKCVNILNCRSAEDGLRLKVHPPICSFQGTTPIVCCTDCLQDQCTTGRPRKTYTDIIGEVLQKSRVRSTRNRRACITSCMNVDEAKGVCKDRSRWGSVVSAYPYGKKTTPVTDIPLDSRFNETRSKARDNCFKYVKKLNYPCRFQRSILYEGGRHPDKYPDYAEPSPLEDVDKIHTFVHQKGPVKRHTTQEQPPSVFTPDHYYEEVPAISHGHPALRNQYPHMALLGYGDDLKTAQWLCGGSVISENYILTAAHCISSPAVGPVKYVALGILMRTDPPEMWQMHNVKRIIPHPQYQPPSKYNDIALLETEKTIYFNINVLPACLHLKPDSDVTAEATGWGALGHHGALADTLQTVTLQRNDEDKCSQLYPKHRHLREGYNHTTQMCYGDAKIAKDTCEGDSGGPLQTRNEFLGCSYTVIGVTSYGRQCGISAGSGMYTRVYHYVPWIESIVWP